MNGKSAIMLVLAVLSGLGAMYGTSQLLSKKGPAPVHMQDVAVAARNLKVEEVLKQDMVKLVSMRGDAVPAGSFKSVAEVVDRGVQIPILSGEAILDAKLAVKGSPAGLVSRIPAGMRAFAIEINEQTGVSGFVLPGHHVDIIQSKTGGTNVPEAEIVLQNVLVLASGQTFNRPDDKSLLSRTVTLALTPGKVDVLAAARSKGPLSLSLRGVNDNEEVKLPEKPVALVAAIPPPPPPPAKKAPGEGLIMPRRRYLLIYHGMQGIERVDAPVPEMDAESNP